MSAYLQQEFDFITRTQRIIEQYKTVNANEKYEVTLLLNCVIGLLVLPQQVWFEKLPDSTINEYEWGISKNDIIVIKKDEEKTVNIIARHLRNSISHYRFTAFNDNKNQISKIEFRDQDMNGNETFKAIIPISNLENFLHKFSNHMLQIMQNEK